MGDTTSLKNKLIVFQLENEEYAISVESVGSIERILPITRVPSTPSFIKGVINLRGVVTPVIDLKSRLKNKDIDFTEQTRIIIVNVDEYTVGFIVDSANDVIDIVEDQVEPPPEAIGVKTEEFIDGVVKLENRLFILLDLEKVLLKDELEQLNLMEG